MNKTILARILPAMCLVLGFSHYAFSEDAEIKLNSNDGSTKMILQDKDAVTVFSADSDGNTVIGGTAAVAGSGFSVGVSTFVVTAGNVGIGTTMPGALLDISHDGTVGLGIVLGAHITDPGAYWLAFRKSRGTASSPLDVVNGDNMGALTYTPYSGGWYFNTASINGNVDGTFVSGQRPPSRLEFYTNVANGAQTERMRIAANGNVGIGTSSPSQKLEVVGTVKATTFQGDGSGLTGITQAVANLALVSNGPLAVANGGTGAGGFNGNAFLTSDVTGTNIYSNVAFGVSTVAFQVVGDIITGTCYNLSYDHGLLSSKSSVGCPGWNTPANIAGGAVGTIPYQSSANTTAMLAAGTAGYVLTGAGLAAPTWTQATNTNVISSIVQRDASGGFAASTITAVSFNGTLNGNVNGNTVTASAFSVGGSTLVVTGGNVGIGTATPGAMLEVSGDAKIAKYTTQANDTGVTLTTADLGKTITVNSASAQTVTLPSITASNIGAQFTIDKLGAGKVTIQAAGGTYIADSTSGGTIYNDTPAESYASITLRLATATKWIIVGGDGSWTTN